MTFPLFDMLYSETEGLPDLTDKEQERFCQSLKKLDTKGSELVYALIKSYAIKLQIDTPLMMGKKCKQGYKFHMSHIPNRLGLILDRFVAKHLITMKEHEQENATPRE